MVAESWRTRDGAWTVDRIAEEPSLTWRVWREQELVAALDGDTRDLAHWLATQGVDIADLMPVNDDPGCE